MKKNAVWITGASRGIGKAVAEKFSSEGLTVLATARDIDSLREMESKSFGNIIAYKLDQGNLGEIRSSYEKFGKLYYVDCLINNAGLNLFKPALETTDQEARSMLDLNLLGAVRSTMTVLPEMIERKSGLIINIASFAAVQGFKNSALYSASKAGLVAYFKVLREEIRGSGVRVTNLLPGATATSIWPENILSSQGGRMISPSEIADFVFGLYGLHGNMVPEEVVLRPILGDI